MADQPETPAPQPADTVPQPAAGAPVEPEPEPEAPAAAPPDEPPRDEGSKAVQAVVTVLTLLIFGLLILIPLSFAEVIFLAEDPATNEVRQVQLLIVSSILLWGALGLFLKAGFGKTGRAKVGARMMHRTKRELVLNGLSVSTTILLILMAVVEVLALLAFLDVIEADTSASIAFASNYVLFATFTLLFLDMLIIARTAYQSRVDVRPWHKAAAYVLLPLSVLVILVGLLVSMGVLTTGLFAGIEPHQSVYIVTLGVLFQLFAFKLVLRYPALVGVALRAVKEARKAGKDMRDEIQKRAFRTYLIGLVFLLVSIFFVGGVATQRIAVQEQRTANFLIIFYLIAGAVVMGLMLTRYLQHRYVQRREQRRERGEVIAKKRLSPEQVQRAVLYSVSGFFATVFVIAGVLTLLDRTPLQPTLGTDLLILAFLTGVGPYGFYHAYKLRRQRALDDKFPDFLRDLAESERAGMTLPRALLTAAQGTYGALTDEIRKMSAQVEWGVSFTVALERFADRVNTPLIQRAVVLITEAASAGGNVIDILTAAAEDAREIKMILEERKRQMAIYSIIIYIAFFVYLVVIFVLAAQFLPGFEEATSASSGQQVGGLNLSGFDKDAFITVFFHGALIQAIGGGLVAGVMTGGAATDGLKHSFTMTILAWIFFRVLL